MCFEDINLQDNEELIFILKIVNMVFAVLFFIEMLLKWVAFGLFRWVSEIRGRKPNEDRTRDHATEVQQLSNLKISIPCD